MLPIVTWAVPSHASAERAEVDDVAEFRVLQGHELFYSATTTVGTYRHSASVVRSNSARNASRAPASRCRR